MLKMNNTVKILKLHKIKDSRKTTLRCRQMSPRHGVWPDQQTRPDNEYYICLRLTRFQDDRFLRVPRVKHCCDTLIFVKKNTTLVNIVYDWQYIGNVLKLYVSDDGFPPRACASGILQLLVDTACPLSSLTSAVAPAGQSETVGLGELVSDVPSQHVQCQRAHHQFVVSFQSILSGWSPVLVLWDLDVLLGKRLTSLFHCL